MKAHNVKSWPFDAREISVYDSSDLSYFQQILEQAYDELWDKSTAKEHRAELKARMAIALFVRAANGERDYDRLKQSATAAALDGMDVDARKSADVRVRVKTTVNVRVVEH